MAGNNRHSGNGFPMYGRKGKKNPSADYTPSKHVYMPWETPKAPK